MSRLGWIPTRSTWENEDVKDEGNDAPRRAGSSLMAGRPG